MVDLSQIPKREASIASIRLSEHLFIIDSIEIAINVNSDLTKVFELAQNIPSVIKLYNMVKVKRFPAKIEILPHTSPLKNMFTCSRFRQGNRN